MASNFRQQIYNLVSKQLGVEKEKITPEAHFAEDLNAGDLEMGELIAHLQKEFGVEFDPVKTEKIAAVDDLVHLVLDKLNELPDEE